MAEATARKKRSFDASFKLKVIDYAPLGRRRGSAKLACAVLCEINAALE